MLDVALLRFVQMKKNGKRERKPFETQVLPAREPAWPTSKFAKIIVAPIGQMPRPLPTSESWVKVGFLGRIPSPDPATGLLKPKGGCFVCSSVAKAVRRFGPKRDSRYASRIASANMRDSSSRDAKVLAFNPC
jgi:hypothetical protein